MSRNLKILLYGSHCADIIGFVFGIKKLLVTGENPDIIVTYGGDGALLGAEREFPGIPKFPIRDNRSSELCKDHSSYALQLGQLADGLLEESKLMKIAGVCGGKSTIRGINDIFIHNSNPVSAIRYRVKIDDEPYCEEIVGDGVGVSTVHGSTAYYRSITHSVFRVGIGLAFSNSTEPTNHLVLPENAEVRIKIVRGPAVLVADNGPDSQQLASGDEILISKTEEFARIIGLDIFMCQKCRKLRHPRE